jgi:hypothetical protein
VIHASTKVGGKCGVGSLRRVSQIPFVGANYRIDASLYAPGGIFNVAYPDYVVLLYVMQQTGRILSGFKLVLISVRDCLDQRQLSEKTVWNPSVSGP